MADVDKDIWEGILIDINYAGGGNAGALLAETSLVQGTDTLVAQDQAKEGSSFPKNIPERNLDADIGDNLYPSDNSTKMVPAGKGVSINNLQTDDWYDRAVNVGKSKGDFPISWTTHADNSIEELDHFGCFTEEYTIEVNAKLETIQTSNYSSRGWKAGNAMTPVPYQTSARAFGSHASFTAVDGKGSAALIVQKLRMKVTNTFNMELARGIGDRKIQQPRFVGRAVELEIWFLNRDSNTWASDARNETAQLINGEIVFGSFLTSTMTNLKVDDSNENEIHKGIHQHYAKFSNGVGFTIA